MLAEPVYMYNVINYHLKRINKPYPQRKVKKNIEKDL